MTTLLRITVMLLAGWLATSPRPLFGRDASVLRSDTSEIDLGACIPGDADSATRGNVQGAGTTISVAAYWFPRRLVAHMSLLKRH
jgi:hypothetical protein